MGIYDRGNIQIAHRRMNVEIGTETPTFLFWNYLFLNFGILSCSNPIYYRKQSPVITLVHFSFFIYKDDITTIQYYNYPSPRFHSYKNLPNFFHH
jgi:hypothetical protein